LDALTGGTNVLPRGKGGGGGGGGGVWGGKTTKNWGVREVERSKKCLSVKRAWAGEQRPRGGKKAESLLGLCGWSEERKTTRRPGHFRVPKKVKQDEGRKSLIQ